MLRVDAGPQTVPFESGWSTSWSAEDPESQERSHAILEAIFLYRSEEGGEVEIAKPSNLDLPRPSLSPLLVSVARGS